MDVNIMDVNIELSHASFQMRVC